MLLVGVPLTMEAQYVVNQLQTVASAVPLLHVAWVVVVLLLSAVAPLLIAVYVHVPPLYASAVVPLLPVVSAVLLLPVAFAAAWL
jgi:membrane protein YdbS with pleckstrin-like domain